MYLCVVQLSHPSPRHAQDHARHRHTPTASGTALESQSRQPEDSRHGLAILLTQPNSLHAWSTGTNRQLRDVHVHGENHSSDPAMRVSQSTEERCTRRQDRPRRFMPVLVQELRTTETHLASESASAPAARRVAQSICQRQRRLTEEAGRLAAPEVQLMLRVSRPTARRDLCSDALIGKPRACY